MEHWLSLYPEPSSVWIPCIFTGKKSVWFRETSKFRAFLTSLKIITSKRSLCFLGTIETTVMDAVLKPATAWLCAWALTLHLYCSSPSRVGSRRFWASQTEQGSPLRSPPREKAQFRCRVGYIISLHSLQHFALLSVLSRVRILSP